MSSQYFHRVIFHGCIKFAESLKIWRFWKIVPYLVSASDKNVTFLSPMRIVMMMRRSEAIWTCLRWAKTRVVCILVFVSLLGFRSMRCWFWTFVFNAYYVFNNKRDNDDDNDDDDDDWKLTICGCMYVTHSSKVIPCNCDVFEIIRQNTRQQCYIEKCSFSHRSTTNLFCSSSCCKVANVLLFWLTFDLSRCPCAPAAQAVNSVSPLCPITGEMKYL